MKKILSLLFLISTSMGVTRLSAYCIYNRSKNETIRMDIYPKKPPIRGMRLTMKSERYIKPGGKTCWNWAEIAKSKDPKKRQKEWYWIATGLRNYGRGYFPIGGAIVFYGYDQNGQAKFQVYFHKERSKKMPPWKYQESPWNHKEQPWETYKRGSKESYPAPKRAWVVMTGTSFK